MAKHHIEHHGAEHVEHHHHKGGGAEVHERMEMDHPDDKKGGHVRRARRARGGKSEPAVHEYNAEGSPTMKEVENETEGFSHGGRKHRKHGGHAEGEHMPHRADKTPRGHHAKGGAAKHHVEHHQAEHVEHHHHRRGGEEHHRRAAGGSVYSTGSKIAMHDKDGDARGHEGVHVPSEPGPG